MASDCIAFSPTETHLKFDNNLDFSLEYFLMDKDANFSIPQKTIEWNCPFAVSIGPSIHNHMVPYLFTTSIRFAKNLAGRS